MMLRLVTCDVSNVLRAILSQDFHFTSVLVFERSNCKHNHKSRASLAVLHCVFHKCSEYSRVYRASMNQVCHINGALKFIDFQRELQWYEIKVIGNIFIRLISDHDIIASSYSRDERFCNRGNFQVMLRDYINSWRHRRSHVVAEGSCCWVRLGTSQCARLKEARTSTSPLIRHGRLVSIADWRVSFVRRATGGITVNSLKCVVMRTEYE